MYGIGDIITPARIEDLRTYDDRYIYKDEVFVVVGIYYVKPELPLLELFNFPGVCYMNYETEQGIRQLESFSAVLKEYPHEVTVQNSNSYDFERYEKSKDRLVYQFFAKNIRTNYLGALKFLEMSKVMHPKHTLQKLEEF